MSTRQGNVGAAELAVSPHRDRLLVASRRERDVGIEAGGTGRELIVAATAAALQHAADIAARLAPGPRNGCALSLDIALQAELVGVAGACQRLLQVQPA